MSENIRICIVGAGSSYTPELIEGLLSKSHEQIPVMSIHMMDTDSNRLNIMSGLSERMIRRSGRNITIKKSTQLEEMLEGADFVITQIRVGGMRARYLDESIPLKYGIIGQETTGPGGMFKALRTIPHMLKISKTVERVAPDAFILNYTNPSGIITEAVRKYTKTRLIGLCSGIPGMRQRLKIRLKESYPDLKTYCVGLNHLGFIHRMISKGKDVTREVINLLYAEEQRFSTDNADISIRLAKLIGAIPIGYVSYYLYRGQRLKEALSAELTRAQKIEKIEQETLTEAALPDTVHKPKALKKRGGSGYSNITFAFMSAICNNTGEELAASVQNHGSVTGIEDDASVEVVCRTDKNGVTPLPVGPIPIAFRGLVQAVKTYETLTVEAAINSSKELAMQALMNHPLAGDVDVIEPLLTEMLNAHGLKFR